MMSTSDKEFLRGLLKSHRRQDNLLEPAAPPLQVHNPNLFIMQQR